jgi:type I restriction enzyme S subunit
MSGWSDHALGDLCRFIDYRGKTPRKTENGLRLITAKNVRMGFLNRYPEEFVSPDSYDAWMTRGIPQRGDVLFTTEAPLGLVCQLDTDEKVVFAQRIITLQTNRNEVDPTFLKYALVSPLLQTRIHENATGATALGIKASLLKKVPVPLPPLPEQERIVAILDEAFEGIATATAHAERNLHNARELFQSVLQSTFQQKGEDWVETTLGEVSRFSSGGTPSKNHAAYWDGQIPWVSGKDMKTDQISDSILHVSQSAVDDNKTRVAPIGSILILVRGMGLANGIRPAEVMSPCTFNQDIKALIPRKDLLPRFLARHLGFSLNNDDQILNSAAHGTLKINLDDLKSSKLAIPPISTQRAIVQKTRRPRHRNPPPRSDLRAQARRPR